MSIPNRVLKDLATFKTLISEVPNFEEGERTFVVVHHMQNDEDEKLLFDLKRFSLSKSDFPSLPEAENIEVEGMDHFVVDDLVGLEMLMRLWVPNLEEMARPSIFGLKSLHSPREVLRRPNVRLRMKPTVTTIT